MKKINAKGLMFISIVITSIMAMPTLTFGNNNTQNNLKNSQLSDGEGELISSFKSSFGTVLGRFGHGGKVLGKVFNMLLLNGFNNDIEYSEMMSGVFVLNAYEEENHTYTNSVLNQQTDIYYLPQQYYPPSAHPNESIYCKVNKTGGFDINITVGAGVTLIIWDHDKSFINAIIKLINFFRVVDLENIDREDIKRGVELITWFLIHINDIFNGDELITLNPIIWQKIELDPGLGMTIEKEWLSTGSDGIIDETDIAPIDFNTTTLFNIANSTGNQYLTHLLKPGDIIINEKLQWTQFTFDLFQLWIKNFQIGIDISKLGRNDPPTFNELFSGLDIEFYLFTHHLAGTFLYNDTNGDNTLSFEGFEDSPYTNNYVPNKTELTHRIFLGNVEKFNYIKPSLVNQEIRWGLNITGANISTIPLGVSLDSYQAESEDYLEYIYFGFKFDPKLSEIIYASDGKRYQVASAPVKLDQYFSPWNSLTDPKTNLETQIDDLDLSIIYISTVLHFHLTLDITYPNYYIEDYYIEDPYQAHHSENHTITIRNYLRSDIANQLEFVDISGPGYYLGNQEEITSEDPSNHRNITTNVFPIILWEYEMNHHDTFSTVQIGSLDDPQNIDTYSANITLEAEFQVVAYAICYPDFNGSGLGILHDPIFNVFMIFEPTIFWALFLLIGGLSSIGIATIVIKRVKYKKVPL